MLTHYIDSISLHRFFLAFSTLFAISLVSACNGGDTSGTSMTVGDGTPLPIDEECQARVDQKGFELLSELPPTHYDPATGTTTESGTITYVACNGVHNGDKSYTLNSGETTLKGVLVSVDSDATPKIFRLSAFVEESDITWQALPVREYLSVQDRVSTVYVEVPATQAGKLQVAVVGYDVSDLEPRFGFNTISYDFIILNPDIEEPATAERSYSATLPAQDPYPSYLAIEPGTENDELTTFAFGSFGGGGNIAFYAFDLTTGNAVNFSCGDGDSNQDLKFFRLAEGDEGIGFTCKFEDPATQPKSLLYLVMNNYHEDPTGVMLTLFEKVRPDQ